MPHPLTSLACLLLVATALGSKYGHGRQPVDGEFSGFESAVEVGGGIGAQPVGYAQPFAQEDAGPEVHQIQDTLTYDPRLPDPPCLWTTWSGCDAPCGGGASYRLRRIADECHYGPGEQLKSCNTQPCPADCAVGEWAEWGCGAGCTGCSVPCGGGTRSRTRPVLSPALFGGRCDVQLSQSEPCNQEACPVDCVAVSGWSEWSQCDQPCGPGRRQRQRDISFVSVVRSGRSQSESECPAGVEEEPCGFPCPIDCLLGEWSDWSWCSESCGEAQQTRHRDVLAWPQNGGNPCLPILEVQPCRFQLPACPVDTPPEQPHTYREFRGEPIILPPLPVVAAVPEYLPTSIPPTTTTELGVPEGFCDSRADGPYEHPDCVCCNDLIMCFQRSAIVKWCPPGEVFVGGQYSKCMKRAIAPNC